MDTTVERPRRALGRRLALKKEVVSSTTAGGERLVVDIIVVGETGGSGNAVGNIVRGGRKGKGGVGPSLTKLLSEGEGEGGRGGMKCK